jgi:hypothetical protein
MLRAGTLLRVLVIAGMSASLLLGSAGSAAACTFGRAYTPAGLVNFVIGHGTATESYRGVDGGVAVGSGTQDPDPTETNGFHISSAISAQQYNTLHWGNHISSQIGWQMGKLQQLPSGVNTWGHTPSVFFEGLDNVADYRAVYGAAETLGRYEVSWGGVSPTGRHKYIAWFQRGGVWYQAGYAELDNQYSDMNAIGEASDNVNGACIRLSASATVLNEVGAPVALVVLTDIWRAWNSAIATLESLDNGQPYKYWNYSAPNFDHIGVGGP